MKHDLLKTFVVIIPNVIQSCDHQQAARRVSANGGDDSGVLLESQTILKKSQAQDKSV